MNPFTIKLIAGVLLAALLYGSGWKTRGWLEDSNRLAEAQAVEQVKKEFRFHEAAVATVLEDKLAQLKANQTIVEKQREIVIKDPVYRNVCLTDDGVRLINAARTGSPAASEPAPKVP